MNTGPIRILVIDDEPEMEALIRMEFRRKIRKKEFDFLFAIHGKDALEQIEAGAEVDVLLCDLNMPVMDGLTFLARLAPQNLLSKPIVVSAYGDMKNIRSAMNLGAFDFVTKPIEFDDLETTIFKAFGELQALKEAERTRQQLAQTEKDLDQAEEQAQKLKELDELKTRLFTHFSHEFRTPLTIIRGMAEEMEEDVKRWTNAGMSMIRRNADHLLHLVNQILDLRKIEAGKLTLQEKAGELVFLVNYLGDSFASMAESKDIQLHVAIEGEELWAYYDESKLLQVFSNLLANAIKYTPLGGRVEVRVNWEKQEGQAILSFQVKDSGIGISPEKLPHIFEQFFQAHAELEAQSTGIGLALTKELVLLMQGEISVESDLDQGSTFSVQIPLRLAEKQQLPESNLKAESFPLKPKLPVGPDLTDALPSLLIVEDNPDIQQYLITCLEGRFALSLARDGQEGIEKALEEIPDIILSDVMMPRKSGFELCEKVKTEEETSHIPIILLTAKADMDSRLMGLGLGADAYLAKPFDKQELLIRMEKLVEIRKSLQKRYQSDEPPTPSDSPTTQKQDAFITQFRSILLRNLDDSSFHVLEMCEAIAMSRSSLHRKVKALTGLSTTHFMQEIRLQKAQELLKTTEESIANIAYQTGFSTPVYFSKSYKAKFGISPRNTRKADA